MQKIIPHLWFDTQAKEAAEFYVSAFKDGKITTLTTLHDTPSGDAHTVTFEIAGYKFRAISAGPYFKINPSISFMLHFDPSQNANAQEELDALWNALSTNAKIMMPLQEYPFSKHYGWLEDKFGVSWQLMLVNPGSEVRPFIVPSLMFTQAVAGKCEEATDFYISVFKNSHRGVISRYPAGSEPDAEGTLMYTDYQLEGQWFVSMDSAHQHQFTFNEGTSLMVECDSQEEIDYYWEKLSAVPESEQCGWLKDRYGVSWQIIPKRMGEMMKEGTEEQIARVVQAFMPMKKFDVAALEAAYAGTTH